MIRNLVLAYIATWAIHSCYLIFLGVKARNLRKEEDELKQSAGI